MSDLPRLHVITHRHHARRGLGSLPDVVGAVIEGGARLIQFRDKDLGADDRLEMGRQLEPHLVDDEVEWLINDRADLAQLLDADGLHCPSDGLPVAEVHRLIDDPWVGVSTHDLEEARDAQASGADFVTLSPIFETDAKPGYGPLLGLDRLDEVTDRLEIPVYALAGITPDRAADCLEAGAHGVAVMSGIMGAERPEEATEQYLEATAASD